MATMTRADFEAFEAWLKARSGPTVEVSFEVELDTGDWVEITELPGVEFSEEDGDWVDTEFEALDRWPEIQTAAFKDAGFAMRMAAEDHAIRRAESGYAQ